MSRNLVEIVRRHHEVAAPTALEVLKEMMELRGEITDEDRRDDGAVSLAEAVCLGLCPASPAIREAEVRGRGVRNELGVRARRSESKVVAVDVRPVAEQASRTPAIAAAS